MDVLNQVTISENLATSGQPSEGQLKEIAEAGFEVVINLAMPDHENSIDSEGSIVTSLGMTYIHLPVPFDAPTDAHFDEFSNYINALKNKKVWVHCIVNARVSAFFYRYFKSAPPDQTRDQTDNPVLQTWLPNMDDVWKKFIDPS